MKYTKETLSVVNPMSQAITGKILNQIPKEMLENDRVLMERLIFINENYGELDGSSLDGIIDDINDMDRILSGLNDVDTEIYQRKIELMKLNDCKLSVKDIFPCYDIPDNEILAQYENIHLLLKTSEKCKKELDEKEFTENLERKIPEDEFLDLTDTKVNCKLEYGCDK